MTPINTVNHVYDEKKSDLCALHSLIYHND
jgi:hypothetical protein